MENTVLFVDDEKNILNSLVRLFRREGYNILTADSGREGLDILKSAKVAVLVSDHRMPGMDGAEFLARAKEVSPSSIRFMLTGYADITAVVSAINKGEVYRYITKPWNDDELKLVIREAVERHNLLEENSRLNDVARRQNAELVELNRRLEARVEEKSGKIKENFFAFVRIFADILELFDPHIGGHSKRVARMARGLALSMRLDEADADLIETAGLLQNIGLIGIPKDIIEKDEDELIESEKALLRHNPALAQDLLSSIDMLRQAGVIIRGHMERYDGEGYPDRLKKEEIHIGARIISVCKRYDDLRSGKKKRQLSEIIGIVKNESGSRFDPVIVEAFLDFIRDWKEGDMEFTVHPADIMSLYDDMNASEIRTGMVLAKDIVTNSGKLLVTKGTVLTRALVEKVLNFNNIDPISGGVHVTAGR